MNFYSIVSIVRMLLMCGSDMPPRLGSAEPSEGGGRWNTQQHLPLFKVRSSHH